MRRLPALGTWSQKKETRVWARSNFTAVVVFDEAQFIADSRMTRECITVPRSIPPVPVGFFEPSFSKTRPI